MKEHKGVTSNTGHNGKRRRIDGSVQSMIAEMRQADFHDHDILVYPDLPSFRQIYSECAREALDNNEIVFLATTYDPIDRVIDSLLESGISVNDETKEGNLIVVDSLRLYQIDVQGAFKFIKSLLARGGRKGKSGIFNISDLGSFFLTERLSLLVDYEQTIPKKIDIPLKGFCSYHESDFASLSKEQQDRILSTHNRVVM